ncbi:maleate cis-trans isomerase family protein [Actinacidiphila sp. ITFR-21]|uniref:maleate cis-trans isomerase family protein n=1 Tax=Actinacidiphila sp. ITFR-21 TaxID=3075199 RepID=UPI00288B7DA3|nr:arylmalonate decarboxylase [Streptomyces sp. ITFR-21]WNI14300.1 arylmalonate decarboxylase [Streptomyces sp. ITFR-21]
MTLDSIPRLGLVVPPANAAAEPEIGGLVHPRLNTHTTRLPVLPGKDLRERLDTYNAVLPQTLGTFGTLRLDAAVIACTGSHYLLSPGGDRALCEALSDRIGAPVASATLAILAAAAAAGVERLVLVSPYQPWLTDLSRDYWEKAGLAVDRVVKVRAGGRFSPYDVTTAELLAQVRDAGVADDAALLFTGTGMSTLAALAELGRDSGRTLLTSNLATAWWALHTAGGGEPFDRPDTHPLLRRLSGHPAAA